MSDLMRDDYKYAYLAGAATTQVVTGAGRLIRIVVNTPIDGSVNVIDGISGSTTNVALIKTATASVNVPYYYYGIKFTTGLRIVVTGASDITVVYTTN